MFPSRKFAAILTAMAAGFIAGCGPRTADAFNAQAPELLAPSGGLDAYAAYGTRNNAVLLAARADRQAAAERIAQAQSLPDPMFSATHLPEEIHTRTGPQRNQFRLSQRLPWPGKLRLKGDVARLTAEQLATRVRQRELTVGAEVKRAYYEYAYLARAIQITDDNLRLLRRLEPVVQQKVKGGAGQSDLLKLQVEIGRVENELAAQKEFRPAASARLRAVLGVESDMVLPWPKIAEPRAVAPQTEELSARMLRDNPELESLEQAVQTGEARIALAKKQGLPDFSLGVAYFETGEAVMTGTSGSGDDPFAVSVSVSLPIARGKYRAGVREQAASTRAARARFRHKQLALRAKLEGELYRLADAGRQIKLYRDTLLPRARQALQLTEAAYRAGNASLLDTIDSQRALLAFQKAYWRAATDYEQSRASLEALCGGTIR